jgi:hypothetical protein
MATSDLKYHWWGGPGSGRVNQNSDDAIHEAERLFRKTYPNVPLPRMSQGGMFGLGGGATQSAGTHDGGGVDDVIPDGLTHTQILFYVTCRRLVGYASWFRPAIPGVWPDHIHSVRIGDNSLAQAARNQTEDFKHGLTGLKGGRKDTLHEWVGWTTWEAYSAAHDKPLEFFGMSALHRATRHEIVIHPGVSVPLAVNDNGDLSLLDGPVSDFYVGGNIRIANLPAGAVLRVYASEWDYKKGSPSELVTKGLQVELVGNTGSTYMGFTFDGALGKSSKTGWSRRLRLLAETDSSGVGPDAPVTVTRLVTTVRK